MTDKIKFETFVDAQGTAFQEYVSSITANHPFLHTSQHIVQTEDVAENVCAQAGGMGERPFQGDSELLGETLKGQFHSEERYALEDQIIKYLPQKIVSLEQRIEGYTADINRLKENIFVLIALADNAPLPLL